VDIFKDFLTRKTKEKMVAGRTPERKAWKGNAQGLSKYQAPGIKMHAY
jgi:hypothetical protein